MLVILVAFITFTTWAKYHTRKLYSEINQSYFTLMAFGIPKNIPPIKLRNWLKDNHKIENIKQIVYCFDVKDIISTVHQFKKVQNVKSYLESYKKNITKEGRNNEEIVNTKDQMEKESTDMILRPIKSQFCCFKRKWPSLDEVNTEVNSLINSLNQNK